MKINILIIIVLAASCMACMASSNTASLLTTADATPTATGTSIAILSPTATNTLSSTPTPATYRVCADNLNMRETPGTQGQIISTLKVNAQVTWTTKTENTPDGGKWMQVKSSGNTGWVNARFLCEPK